MYAAYRASDVLHVLVIFFVFFVRVVTSRFYRLVLGQGKRNQKNAATKDFTIQIQSFAGPQRNLARSTLDTVNQPLTAFQVLATLELYKSFPHTRLVTVSAKVGVPPTIKCGLGSTIRRTTNED